MVREGRFYHHSCTRLLMTFGALLLSATLVCADEKPKAPRTPESPSFKARCLSAFQKIFAIFDAPPLVFDEDLHIAGDDSVVWGGAIDPRTGRRVGAVRVTGPESHTLKTIVNGLRLSKEEVMNVRGLDVVLFGEGYSQFLSMMLTYGARAKAVDPWYHNTSFPNNREGRLMAEFNDTYSEYLIRGDAATVDLPEASQDRVYSYDLVNNIGGLFENKLAFLDRAIYLLRAGGEARFHGFVPRHKNELLRLRHLGYNLRIDMKFEEFEFDYQLANGKWKHETSFLVIVTKLDNHVTRYRYKVNQPPPPAEKGGKLMRVNY